MRRFWWIHGVMSQNTRVDEVRALMQTATKMTTVDTPEGTAAMAQLRASLDPM
ncbi:hypothetical protein [Marinimicrobium locisalis]|uniref:hypothetical protein n=1 Tax=Marinimicrobium locisalis TaxID=546022 RepID=UPI003221A257